MPANESVRNEWPQYSFIALLGWILAMLILSPFMTGWLGRIALNFVFTFIMLSAIYALSKRRIEMLLGAILAFPAVLLQWLDSSWIIVSTLASLLFLGYAIVILFRRIFLAEKIEKQLIFGAVSIYFLLGIFWAFLYVLVAAVFPGAFNNVHGIVNPSFMEAFQGFLYFSFVTLATLGYGDIVPLIGIARHLSFLEAIVGQLYLATLVAGLVGTFRK